MAAALSAVAGSLSALSETHEPLMMTQRFVEDLQKAIRRVPFEFGHELEACFVLDAVACRKVVSRLVHLDLKTQGDEVDKYSTDNDVFPAENQILKDLQFWRKFTQSASVRFAMIAIVEAERAVELFEAWKLRCDLFNNLGLTYSTIHDASAGNDASPSDRKRAIAAACIRGDTEYFRELFDAEDTFNSKRNSDQAHVVLSNIFFNHFTERWDDSQSIKEVLVPLFPPETDIMAYRFCVTGSRQKFCLRFLVNTMRIGKSNPDQIIEQVFAVLSKTYYTRGGQRFPISFHKQFTLVARLVQATSRPEDLDSARARQLLSQIPELASLGRKAEICEGDRFHHEAFSAGHSVKLYQDGSLEGIVPLSVERLFGCVSVAWLNPRSIGFVERYYAARSADQMEEAIKLYIDELSFHSVLVALNALRTRDEYSSLREDAYGPSATVFSPDFEPQSLHDILDALPVRQSRPLRLVMRSSPSADTFIKHLATILRPTTQPSKLVKRVAQAGACSKCKEAVEGKNLVHTPCGHSYHLGCFKEIADPTHPFRCECGKFLAPADDFHNM